MTKNTSILDRVLKVLKKSRKSGLTDQEIQVLTGIGPQSQTPARRLLTLTGQVADSGKTRPTKSGRSATVWVPTQAAFA